MVTKQLSRYEFQCKARDYKQRIVEQYNIGNNTSVVSLGRELTKFIEEIHRTTPDYLNGLDPVAYTKRLVNS